MRLRHRRDTGRRRKAFKRRLRGYAPSDKSPRRGVSRLGRARAAKSGPCPRPLRAAVILACGLGRGLAVAAALSTSRSGISARCSRVAALSVSGTDLAALDAFQRGRGGLAVECGIGAGNRDRNGDETVSIEPPGCRRSRPGALTSAEAGSPADRFEPRCVGRCGMADRLSSRGGPSCPPLARRKRQLVDIAIYQTRHSFCLTRCNGRVRSLR